MVAKPAKLQPALVGGLIVGLGSVVPYVNFCCCGWAIVGGALAAYMLTKRSTVLPITKGDGASAGSLAGIVGSLVYLVIGVPLTLLRWSDLVGQMQQRGDSVADAASRQMFRQVAGTMESHPVLIALVIWLIIAALSIGFSALGGVIGVAIFEKRKGQGFPPPPAPTGFAPDYGPMGGSPTGQAPYGGGPASS